MQRPSLWPHRYGAPRSCWSMHSIRPFGQTAPDLHFVTVVDDGSADLDDVKRALALPALEGLAKTDWHAQLHVRRGDGPEEITDLASEIRAHLLVIGRFGTHHPHREIGDTAGRVIELGDVPGQLGRPDSPIANVPRGERWFCVRPMELGFRRATDLTRGDAVADRANRARALGRHRSDLRTSPPFPAVSPGTSVECSSRKCARSSCVWFWRRAMGRRDRRAARAPLARPVTRDRRAILRPPRRGYVDRARHRRRGDGARIRDRRGDRELHPHRRQRHRRRSIRAASSPPATSRWASCSCAARGTTPSGARPRSTRLTPRRRRRARSPARPRRRRPPNRRAR